MIRVRFAHVSGGTFSHVGARLMITFARYMIHGTTAYGTVSIRITSVLFVMMHNMGKSPYAICEQRRAR